jgi:hypothetical protein
MNNMEKEKIGNNTNKHFINFIRQASNIMNRGHKKPDISYINANNISEQPNCKIVIDLSDTFRHQVIKVSIAESDGWYEYTYSYHPRLIDGAIIGSIWATKSEKRYYCKGDYLRTDKSGIIYAHFTKKEINEHYLTLNINKPRHYKVLHGDQEDYILSPGLYIARYEPDSRNYAIKIDTQFRYKPAAINHTIMGNAGDWLVKKADYPIVNVVKSDDFASGYMIAESPIK